VSDNFHDRFRRGNEARSGLEEQYEAHFKAATADGYTARAAHMVALNAIHAEASRRAPWRTRVSRCLRWLDRKVRA
jgi:hypothetical protein